MDSDKLKVIAGELISRIRTSVSTDWTLRESARARIGVLVKRILNKYAYPPDLQDAAVQTVQTVQTVLASALLCANWA